MHRLFAAIPIPSNISGPLTDLQKSLTGASWRPEENFHITLRFFGDVDRKLAEELDLHLAEIDAPQMLLEVRGVGWFGRREPYAVFARIAENEALTRLAGACERAARRTGLPPEKRRFRPHITLAYCHGTPLEEAMSWSERHQAHEGGPFWADRFHLYESHLRRGPSLYVAEAEYPLR